jgi:hypothetical protein
LTEARERLNAMHRRCQQAEAALPEWKEIAALSREQRTGRFGPALAASSVIRAEEENAALKERLALIKEIALSFVQKLPNGGDRKYWRDRIEEGR